MTHIHQNVTLAPPPGMKQAEFVKIFSFIGFLAYPLRYIASVI